ncbi:uncharacterized protein L969DRAFT_87508 [Mixia osmundae IAM 14324]|uniref:uncharacterized protein n=1 Tax=Mixia osmundae (strain CBS 9802 / IAM 14324 / JCM 22182 / KY 12970) TaxID=764103 RepID=UPI0004A54E42|nr:uncharacterized protein L969DRAFT_87508 [Mixia osmundae IAM 14324]KEI39556.1 hypothetical protein L969DRAFT_87508 [Mixia osmundae IAM 14324]
MDDEWASSIPAIPSLHGLDRAIAVILVSEIGDKTFLLAAILAMRHPRLTIFSGALGALAVMSVLSALLGHVLPTLLPKRYTTIAAALLFLVFGARMLQEGLGMEGGNASIEEEMREVQKEIENAEREVASSKRQLTGSRGTGETIDLQDMEEGSSLRELDEEAQANGIPISSPLLNGHSNGSTSRRPSSPSPLGARRSRQPSVSLKGILPARSREAAGDTFKEGAKNLLSIFFSPILVQSFVLTFLAEWGDRSQITTIALGAAHNVGIVSLGTIIGHSICTAVAVLGGRWIANRISVKHVTLGGAGLFLIFGLVYTYEAVYWSQEPIASPGLINDITPASLEA